MYISRIQIKNFRNLQEVDTSLYPQTIVIGENNSGKTNLLRALTLPLSVAEIGVFNKMLGWDDINTDCKNQYIEYVNSIKTKILSDTVDAAEFEKKIPKVEVIITFQPQDNTVDRFYLKKLLTNLSSEEEEYKLSYRFYIKETSRLLERLKEVFQAKGLDENTKHSLLPIEFYRYEIASESNGGNAVGFSELMNFKYEFIAADRDEFSSNVRQIGSKLFIKLLSNRLTGESRTAIEKGYNDFFKAISDSATIDDLINWQKYSDLDNAQDFFSDMQIQPNMPSMYNVLNSARLGLKDAPLSSEGLGFRNLLFLLVLLNSSTSVNEGDPPFRLIQIEEPEAHLSLSNEKIVSSFLSSTEIKASKCIQLVFDTHSTNFIDKNDLSNVVVVSEGKAFSLGSIFDKKELEYLSRNPNQDIYNFLFAKKLILVEGPSEELLIRAYQTQANKQLHNATVISFHKGFTEVIEKWKKIHNTDKCKMVVIRDFDNEVVAQERHESLDSCNVRSFTTKTETLEPEIIRAEANFLLLRQLFCDELHWDDSLNEAELLAKWREDKLNAMVILCREYSHGNLSSFELPEHIAEAIAWLEE